MASCGVCAVATNLGSPCATAETGAVSSCTVVLVSTGPLRAVWALGLGLLADSRARGVLAGAEVGVSDGTDVDL